MRVAYLSPLPPEASGIADYSAELLPLLAAELEVELFAPAATARRRTTGPAGIPLRSVTELAGLAAGGRYGAVIYHLGNHHRFHGWIYEALLETPGVVVLHEYVLHHLVQALTLGRGDADGYAEELRYEEAARLRDRVRELEALELSR